DATLLPPPERAVPVLVAAERPKMLGLAAQHADIWQTAWYGLPGAEFSRKRAAFVAACGERGGSSPAVGVAVGVSVGELDDDGRVADRSIALDAAAIAEALAAWSAQEVDHVQLGVFPLTRPRLDIVLDAIDRSRR
ncbi:MAG TPA: LLM class flavin-dependent oxidoreductase, partial [Acidimicrobiales bacterium]|nr:LLM class flavin-dependent oxidoreductase [Acidimicrobiales bacterium]